MYQTLTYEIMASKGKKLQVNVASYEKRKCLEASRDLLQMRMGKLPVDQWCVRTKELLADMKDKGYYSAECQLFEAYAAIQDQRPYEARILLDSLENNQRVQKEEVLEGAFLYLCELAGRSVLPKKEVLERLRQLHQRRNDSFLLLAMIFELDTQEIRPQSRKMFLLEEEYRTGCRSPFLYLEACNLGARTALCSGR